MIVDLSHNNPGTPDFKVAKAAGLQGVFLKATQGTDFSDPAFVDRFNAADDQRLLIGAYHFLTGNHDPAEQMRFFLDTVEEPYDEIKLAIDLEINTTPGETTATVAQAVEAVEAFTHLTGRLPLLYIGRWGIDGKGTGLPNAILSACDLWLPEYGPAAHLPPGWKTWKLWQFSRTGKLAGIKGNVDLSRWNGADPDLAKWWAA